MFTALKNQQTNKTRLGTKRTNKREWSWLILEGGDETKTTKIVFISNINLKLENSNLKFCQPPTNSQSN